MKFRLCPVLLPLLLGLAACAAEYSKSEAPARLRIDGAETRHPIAFAAGSAALSLREARQIDGWVRDGSLRPADRVTIAAAGPPLLAEARTAAISRELLRWGVVATPVTRADVPANRAVVSIGRYAVTLPACPNWSSPSTYDFTNATSSNFGCTDATNLGLMVASPADLVAGQTLQPAAGQPVTAAVDRYLTDKVTPLPIETALGPISGGGGGGGAAAGGAGAGAGAGGAPAAGP